MATVNASYLSLADQAQRMNARGDIIQVINMLAEVNPIFSHALWTKCNEGRQHTTGMVSSLPAGTWTSLYQGIPNEKSRRTQVTDSTAMLESLSTVDTRLLALAKDPAQMRLEEASLFIEGMSQTFTDVLLYGDGTNKTFLGLTPRFNSTTLQNGNQVVLGGGAGSDNTSVWIVTWSPMTCTMIYPDGMEGLSMGVKREDKGEQRVLDGSSNAYYVMEDMFGICGGLSVRDWRYVTRIANLDVSALAAGSVDTLGLLRTAFYRHEGRRNMIGGKTCIYARKEFIEALDEDMVDKTNVQLNYSEADGNFKASTSYRGFPIYEVDKIRINEALAA